MANMNHCPACARHYYLHERACPHCGAEAPGGRKGRFVRRARMGGLMLFTALTTTACYGPSPPYNPAMGGAKTRVEEPLSRVPTTVGTAVMFVTPKGGKKVGKTLKLERAILEGTALTLVGKEIAYGGVAAGFVAAIEAQEAAAFVAPPPDEPFAALPPEKMKAFKLDATYPNAQGKEVTLGVELPGATGVQGGLQLSRLEADVIGGVLRIDYADTLVEIYFLAAR